jgi:hypothetical protein
MGGGGEEGSVYRIVVRKNEGKRTTVRQRYRPEDNIKMDLQEVACRRLE